MSIGAIIVVLFTAFLILVSTLVLLKNGRIPVKFAVLWLLVFLVLLLVGCIPNVIMNIAAQFGFKTMSNMLTGVLIVMLFFMCMALTIIVSGQKTRITLLTQELSMLKEKIEKKEKENG